ncbi:MAG TPA: RagB/SusD family nutrient uptake outer membrane protein [Chryseosolibacter sp.]|nr:RagB/SusD family nutrient uptake outer membrane protein [Chryseosolibacter sp.]
MKKLFILSVIGVLITTSCESDLDILNPNEATVEAFWKNGDDAVAGVNAVYSTLHRGAISRWMPFYYIVRADEGRSTSPATDIVNNMDQFIVTDYNFWGAYDIWKDLYVGVFRANQVLDNVPNITMDETLKQRVIGEAKFLRGLFYYNLASLWGNVPLMLRTSAPNDKPATSLMADVWVQVEQDLSEAAAVLPTTYGAADLGRATKGAANALLAKAYMQQGEYNLALTPLQWLVEGDGKNVYSLMPNYRDNFLISTENNSESVFEWQFELNPGENHDDDTDMSRPDNLNYGTSLAQFFGPSGIGWSDGEAHRWLINEFLVESTTGGQRDPRLAASLLFDYTDPAGPDATMIYGETFTQRYGPGNNRVWFRKFQNDHWKNFEGYNSPNNWRYIRYADVLLMYAEALNATGSTATAYQYVDRVRQRAGLATLTSTMPGLNQQQFLAQLKHERITELTGEGHRWNDLARWGDLGPGLVSRDPGFSNFEVGKHELLPIPQQEIDINPGLDQNPDW